MEKHKAKVAMEECKHTWGRVEVEKHFVGSSSTWFGLSSENIYRIIETQTCEKCGTIERI